MEYTVCGKPHEGRSYSLFSYLHSINMFKVLKTSHPHQLTGSGIPSTLDSCLSYGGSYILHPALRGEIKASSGGQNDS